MAPRPPRAREYPTRVDFPVRIPMRDGVRLGATVVRPDAPGRFPALVWYDPYRGGWSGAGRSDYLAERGYAVVTLQARGTANSEGVNRDEYMAEETRDGCDAVQWLAEQPWCNGNVGMLGASYSGFTALQVAALAPPALKAIAPAFFTDRRYTDDCHYKGGCLRGYFDVLTYGLSMVARNALPPHPLAVGAQWAEMWRQRLEESEPYLLKWLAHPLEDDYWAQGSVIGQYDRIQAACLLIGGWHDGYVNPPLSTFRALTAPKKLLMGPWNHTYPDTNPCGPRIDIYYELLLWWDRWLKGMDNGVDREPRVLVYVQEFEEPIQDRTEIAGGWYAAEDLPDVGVGRWALGVGDGQLLPETVPPASSTQGPRPNAQRPTPNASEGIDRFRYLPGASRNGGVWDGGMRFGLPGDQRADEALAINYTSEPLEQDVVLLGQPVVELTVSADVPVMPFAVRLAEVAEVGTSVLVTKGILNATRRHGMDRAEPLVPGRPTPIQLELEATAWRFRAGNRIRLSINGSDFPNVWPTPLPGEGAIHRGPGMAAALHLPLWTEATPSPVELLPSPNPPTPTGAGGSPPAWRVIHDVLEDRWHFVLANGNEFVVSNRNPAEAYARAMRDGTAEWPGFRARSEASAALTSDEKSFHITISLNVSVNDAPHFQRRWCESFARKLL